MVMRQKFDSVCQELGKALSRERQAQELLNEQSRQLEELGMRLNLYTTEELEKDVTITEAVKVGGLRPCLVGSVWVQPDGDSTFTPWRNWRKIVGTKKISIWS